MACKAFFAPLGECGTGSKVALGLLPLLLVVAVLLELLLRTGEEDTEDKLVETLECIADGGPVVSVSVLSEDAKKGGRLLL